MPNPVTVITRHNRDRQGVTPAESTMLATLNRYHYLSASQVCRLLYSSGSQTYVQAHLKRLTDAGYCQRLWLPRASQRGSAPSVYTLARRGINHLQEAGTDPQRRYRPSERKQLSYLFLNHTLTLNDFLISVELMTRQAPHVELGRLLHEQDLKRRPFRVETPQERLSVVPDAWLDLRVRGHYQVCLLVELDMGTEEQKKWRRKVRGLLALASGPYQEAFGTTSLTIAVVVATGSDRLKQLIDWTEAELHAAGEEQQASLFLFVACSPADTTPETLFFQPCWHQPFGDHHALALFEGVG